MAFPTDDHQLIRRAMDGDEQSLDQVLRHWTPQIVSWCRRLSGPRVDPDDVFQEVVEKVITRMDTLREPAAFPGWLFQVVRSQANRQRRRAWVRKVTGWFEGQPEGPAKGASPERHADLGETSLQVMAVLDRIPDEQRDILVLCFIEERSQAEVAELLGLPVGTVKSRIRLARSHFIREAKRVSPDLAAPPEPSDDAYGGLQWTTSTP
ncbi:MAG: RNA polymerase sigma factor [Deltaproteobacteria bacterium]|nr:RNA polymerase sigma factor [Deltaproteobacteria bacterium]